MMESVISNVGEFLADARVMAVYWGLAIFGTLFFGLTCLLAFFGVGGLDSPDFDTDGMTLEHPDTGFLDFKLFSLRSILAFLTVFGWAESSGDTTASSVFSEPSAAESSPWSSPRPSSGA